MVQVYKWLAFVGLVFDVVFEHQYFLFLGESLAWESAAPSSFEPGMLQPYATKYIYFKLVVGYKFVAWHFKCS